MRILALDSSGLVASVAVAEDDNLLAEYTVNYKKTHSQTLLPMLDEVSKLIELDLESLDAIAVSAGPGSFTGLRIGSATAKGLGLALGKPLIAVPTLEALAYNLYGASSLVCPIMDARRNQVYTGIYSFVQEGIPYCETSASREPAFAGTRIRMRTEKEQSAVEIGKLVEELNGLGREVIFLGDGVLVYKERILSAIQVPCTFAPLHLNRQHAGAVAALGMQYYREGKIQSAAEHQPEYLRVSQAERERAEREAKKV